MSVAIPTLPQYALMAWSQLKNTGISLPFYLYCVYNGSGAHPASYPMGTECAFSVGKAAGA
jgi:hypothetical protein